METQQRKLEIDSPATVRPGHLLQGGLSMINIQTTDRSGVTNLGGSRVWVEMQHLGPGVDTLNEQEHIG